MCVCVSGCLSRSYWEASETLSQFIMVNLIVGAATCVVPMVTLDDDFEWSSHSIATMWRTSASLDFKCNRKARYSFEFSVSFSLTLSWVQCDSRIQNHLSTFGVFDSLALCMCKFCTIFFSFACVTLILDNGSTFAVENKKSTEHDWQGRSHTSQKLHNSVWWIVFELILSGIYI